MEARQEPILTAGVFALTGSSVEALRVRPDRPVRGRRPADVADWRSEPSANHTRGSARPCSGSGPAYVVWKSTRAHGFYGAGARAQPGSRAARRFASPSGRRGRDALLLGLSLGLGLWATPQVFVVALPAVGWLVWRRREVLRYAWLVARRRRASGRSRGSSRTSGTTGTRSRRRLAAVPRSTASTASFARRSRRRSDPVLPFTLEWLGGAVLGGFAYAVLLAALVWTLVRRRAQLGPLVPVLALFPVFYALSPWSWLNAEPRYFVLICADAGARPSSPPVERPGGAWRSPACWRRSRWPESGLLDRRGRARRVLGRCRPSPPTSTRSCARSRPTASGTASPTCWLGWRVVFESDEEILVVPAEGRLLRQSGRTSSDSVEQRRYPAFHRAACWRTRTPHTCSLPAACSEARLRPLLLDAGYRRLRTGDFVVYLRA